MSVELLQMLSLVSYIVAGVLFLLAVALFFLLSIPRVFGDITGANARKAIENIRQQNEGSGDKAYKPSPVNAVRGKITDKISPSGKIERKTGNFGVAVETAKLSTAQLAREAQETKLLNDDQNETTVLNNPANETTVLQLEESKDGFAVDFEIGFIGSAEIIE